MRRDWWEEDDGGDCGDGCDILSLELDLSTMDPLTHEHVRVLVDRIQAANDLGDQVEALTLTRTIINMHLASLEGDIE